MPGDDAVGRTLSYVVAEGHGYTVISALRSSDFPGATRDSLITDTSVTVTDHQTVAHTLWNRYDNGDYPGDGASFTILQ